MLHSDQPHRFSKVGDLAVRLNCGHFFHRHCIEPWSRRSAICPSCRVPIKNQAASSKFALKKAANRNAHEEQVKAMALAMRLMEEEEKRARRKRAPEIERASTSPTPLQREGDPFGPKSTPASDKQRCREQQCGDRNTKSNSCSASMGLKKRIEELPTGELRKRLDEIGIVSFCNCNFVF